MADRLHQLRAGHRDRARWPRQPGPIANSGFTAEEMAKISAELGETAAPYGICRMDRCDSLVSNRGQQINITI